jgi:hypothetical protein
MKNDCEVQFIKANPGYTYLYPEIKEQGNHLEFTGIVVERDIIGWQIQKDKENSSEDNLIYDAIPILCNYGSIDSSDGFIKDSRGIITSCCNNEIDSSSPELSSIEDLKEYVRIKIERENKEND